MYTSFSLLLFYHIAEKVQGRKCTPKGRQKMDGYPLSHFNGKPYPSTYHGTPEGTRTPDLLIRSQSLYPTELPAHTTHFLNAPAYNSTPEHKMQVFFSFFSLFF